MPFNGRATAGRRQGDGRAAAAAVTGSRWATVFPKLPRSFNYVEEGARFAFYLNRRASQASHDLAEHVFALSTDSPQRK